MKIFGAGNNEAAAAGDQGSIKEVLDGMDERVARVYDSLPNNSVLIVLSGHGKVAPARKLLARREESRKNPEADKSDDKTDEAQSEDLGAPVDAPEVSDQPQAAGPPQWTKKDDLMLEEAIKIARQGLGFFCVKTPEEEE